MGVLMGKELTDKCMSPLVVLKPNKFVSYLALLFIVFCTVFTLFFVVLPVFNDFSFAAVWPEGHGRLITKKIIFMVSIVFLFFIPSFISLFNKGVMFFYRDCLVVAPFLKKKKIIINYDDMKVKIYGKHRVVILNNDFSFCGFFTRIIKKYFESITLGLSPRGWDNPEDIQKALNVLQKNAYIVEKL